VCLCRSCDLVLPRPAALLNPARDHRAEHAGEQKAHEGDQRLLAHRVAKHRIFRLFGRWRRRQNASPSSDRSRSGAAPRSWIVRRAPEAVLTRLADPVAKLNSMRAPPSEDARTNGFAIVAAQKKPRILPDSPSPARSRRARRGRPIRPRAGRGRERAARDGDQTRCDQTQNHAAKLPRAPGLHRVSPFA